MSFYCLLLFGIFLPGIFGKTELGFKAFTKYEPGNMNIIITAPHGGHLNPSRQANGDYWRSRKDGCKGRNGKCIWTHNCGATSANCDAKTTTDMYTAILARDIAKAIKDITGFRPHVVYNRLKRSKLDANREINEATLNVTDAIKAYEDYAKFINKAKSAIRGRGLILDIHGQAHRIERTELGYLIYGSQLDKGVFRAEKTSIRSLGKYLCRSNSRCFKELVRGNRSLGHFMNQEDLRAVPSPQEPAPNKATYFSGGYTVKTYGSRYRGDIDAIQMEFPKKLRTKSGWRNVKNGVARAISSFFKLNYGI